MKRRPKGRLDRWTRYMANRPPQFGLRMPVSWVYHRVLREWREHDGMENRSAGGMFYRMHELLERDYPEAVQ